MQETTILSTFAATLFALLNPLGMLPVFIGYTTGMSQGVQRWLALFVSLTVLGLMLLFLLTGTAILDFFGVTLDSFRLAGGILLLLIGIHIVTADPGKAAKDLAVDAEASALSKAESVYRQIVVPFAMPLLVGPGVIANLILYASEARTIHSPALSLGLIGVTVAISLLTLVILLSGRVLRRLLGDVGLNILTRILGLLVASIGMQFVVTGLSNVIVHSIAPAVLKLH
ncbi:MAG: MarC family protein [Candidatus Contendobacter sp.]|jgi:MarC family membrane protein|nr:MarC family protein [Candidatus Contendobacter sp.]